MPHNTQVNSHWRSKFADGKIVGRVDKARQIDEHGQRVKKYWSWLEKKAKMTKNNVDEKRVCAKYKHHDQHTEKIGDANGQIRNNMQMKYKLLSID